jgi:hypothetical protein
MSRATVVVVTLTLALVGAASQADAQSRRDGRDARTRNEIARMQGIPPGQMPPANQCRVWYDNRPNGRQPSPTRCADAERIAARDRNSRVIYGENVYDDRYAYGGTYDPRYPNDPRYPDNNRGVYRVPGQNRRPGAQQDPYYPGSNDPYYDRSRYTTPGFQQGYRDGLEKGREDADDRDNYDPNRHSWYRSATRGYEDEYGPRSTYQARYRDGFQAGYAEGYRAFQRR